MTKLLHPDYTSHSEEWKLHRAILTGGQKFVDDFLQKFSNLETNTDYQVRKDSTYCPSEAYSAVNKIRNALFASMVDVARKGGEQYQAFARNCDRNETRITSFLGGEILLDLLGLGKVGIFVDANPKPPNADATFRASPYVYKVAAEDILSWAPSRGPVERVLIRRWEDELEHGLPKGLVEVKELYYYKSGDKVFKAQLDSEDKPINEVETELTQIPLIILQLPKSLLRDVGGHQVSLLQLASTDINYLMKSNFPIYVEQGDAKYESHIRTPSPQGTGSRQSANTGAPTTITQISQALTGDENRAGAMVSGNSRGRKYFGQNAPEFINPSADPVKISMEKQAKLEQDIHRLVDLALQNIASYAAADSKRIDRSGLEAGLCFVAEELERGEREIAKRVAEFTGEPAATITYPKTFSLKTAAERRSEAKEISGLASAVNSRAYRVHLQRQLARTLIPGIDYDEIDAEIEENDGLPSDPETLKTHIEIGLVSSETASSLAGYDEDEWEKAEASHARRVERLRMISNGGGTHDPPDPHASPSGSIKRRGDGKGK